MRLATGYGDLELGESVAVNGVCLTVTRFTPDGRADFFASTETLDRTNLGAITVGHKVNLERSVSLNTRALRPYGAGSCRWQRRVDLDHA